MEKSTDKSQKYSESLQVVESDLYLLKNLQQIQKNLFEPSIFIWVDQNIENEENRNNLFLMKINGFDPILCQTVAKVKETLNNHDDKTFRIISSAKIAEDLCKQLHKHERIIHIYIFCRYKSVGETLMKKWKKIKFFSIDVDDFLVKIQIQSRYDGKYLIFPNFIQITNYENNQDITAINKLRYGLHGLTKFKNKGQAKQDFIKLAKYLFSYDQLFEDVPFKTQIQQFQKEYPTQYDYPKILNWYTKPTFFYGLLNNFIRNSRDPMETPYVRLPFDNTLKAIKAQYDQIKNKKGFQVYRGGKIDQKQLESLKNNIGEYIEMYGFMSTSKSQLIAMDFLLRTNGNSLITVIVKDEQRQSLIDYGYVNLTKYSDVKNQQQVLFNALNVYKIISFEKKDFFYNITLQYGQLARIIKVGQTKMLQKQQKIIWNYKHQQEIINNHINNQGDVFKYCQMYEKEIQYRKKLQIENKEKQNITKAKQLNKLGEVYDQKGEYNKALQYYERALKIKINVLGQNHTSTSITINNIGLVYDQKGEYNKALQYYERALKIQINVLGQNHTSTSTLNNIGSVYKNKGEYNKALQYYERALKIKINVLGQNHTSTSITINNIGLVYDQKGEYNKALQYYERALKIQINVLGQNHTSTSTLNNIGSVYKNKGEYNKALQYYERALKIQINVLGQNHTSTSITINNIGLVYDQKGEYNKALQYYERALKIKINVLGQNHTSTSITINNIGLVYDQKGEYNKALQYYERALKIKINVLGQNHTSTSTTLRNIGFVYFSRKLYLQATTYFKRCYNIRLHIFGQDHESTKQILTYIHLCFDN